MDTLMVTGGLGFTGRHIVEPLAGASDRFVSYNRTADHSSLASSP